MTHITSERDERLEEYIDLVDQLRIKYILSRASVVELLHIVEERLHIEQHTAPDSEPNERDFWIEHYVNKMEEVRDAFPGWISKYTALRVLNLIERRIHAEQDAILVKQFGRNTGL